MATVKPLTIAYTPDSDDAFYYDALETGRVPLPGYRPAFQPRADERAQPRPRCAACTMSRPFPPWSIRKSPSATRS